MTTTQTQLKAVSTADDDPLEPAADHPRNECWCASKDIPCFAHYITEGASQ